MNQPTQYRVVDTSHKHKWYLVYGGACTTTRTNAQTFNDKREAEQQAYIENAMHITTWRNQRAFYTKVWQGCDWKVEPIRDHYVHRCIWCKTPVAKGEEGDIVDGAVFCSKCAKKEN